VNFAAAQRALADPRRVLADDLTHSEQELVAVLFQGNVADEFGDRLVG
jgi:hypothetical protein